MKNILLQQSTNQVNVSPVLFFTLGTRRFKQRQTIEVPWHKVAKQYQRRLLRLHNITKLEKHMSPFSLLPPRMQTAKREGGKTMEKQNSPEFSRCRMPGEWVWFRNLQPHSRSPRESLAVSRPLPTPIDLSYTPQHSLKPVSSMKH